MLTGNGGTSNRGSQRGPWKCASGCLDTSGSLDDVAIDFQHNNILAGLRDAHEERQRLRDATQQVDERLTSIVAAAREYGISWQQIGGSLETSKQAAWERFGWLDKRFSSPGLSLIGVRGLLASWRGRSVRVLLQSPHEGIADHRLQGPLDWEGTANTDLATYWVGGKRRDRMFTLEPGSFRDARIIDSGTLVVELSGGQVEITPSEPATGV